MGRVFGGFRGGLCIRGGWVSWVVFVRGGGVCLVVGR